MIRDLALGKVIYLSASTPSTPTPIPPSPSPKQLFTFDPTFSFYPYSMSLLQEALLSQLNNSKDDDDTGEGHVEPDSQTIIDALEEFAWASIAAGKRVREYCEELSEVLVRAHHPATLQKLLHTGTLAILFPFIRVTSPYFPSPPPFPPPLVPAPSLSNLGRKHLIDALSKLSHQTNLPRDSLYTEGLISEVVLEYIGRKWRTSVDDVVELVGRKLTEIEFEVQMQGDLPIVRTAIHPAVQKARFLLGFLSSAQLVVRLNASSHASIPHSDRVRPDPEQLVRAYITRRLASGYDPTLVVLDLVTAQRRLNSASHKSMIITTIASFGLRSDVPPASEFGETAEPASPSPTATSFGPTISPRRATFSRLANKLASKRPIPVAPKWLTHRKNYSYSAKIAVPVPTFNPDRRPSLPNIPSMPSVGSFTHIKSPLGGSTASFHAHPETVRENSQEWEEVGVEAVHVNKDQLLQRLLQLRYRVPVEGGWYLGKAKQAAKGLLDRSNIDPQDISELREQFALSVQTPLPEGDAPKQEIPAAPTLVPISPGGVTGTALPPRDLISPLSFASFDLEEYYARIASARSSHAPKLSLASITSSVEVSSDSNHTATLGSHKAKRRSMGVESCLTEWTHQQGRRSRMSAFSIREATKEWPLESKAVMYDFPSPALATNGIHSDPSNDKEEVFQSFHRHTRSRSETDLLALINKPPASTVLPYKAHSLRRTRHVDSQLQVTLSAYQLGLPAPSSPVQVPTPALPPVPDFHLQAASDDADHELRDMQSLLLSTTNPSSLTPPHSPESSAVNTPRPGEFPLPPNSIPFRDPFARTPTAHSHRQYTVINGQVSPSRLGQRDDDTGDYFALPPATDLYRGSNSPSAGTETLSAPSSSSSKRFRDKALPVPPRTSSLARRRPDGHVIRPKPLASDMETPLSLALSLFEISKLPPTPDNTGLEGASVITPRRDLSVDDVNIVLGDMVDSERARVKSRDKQWDDAARCRVGWLMDQVGDLLNEPRFWPIIDVHLDRLAPVSPRHKQLERLSPNSSTTSIQTLPRLKPSSPLALSRTSLMIHDSDDDFDRTPAIPQSSPRPPPRSLARAISPAIVRPPQATMMPISPLGKAPTRPLPPRPTARQAESRGSDVSRRSSKLSIGTFGH